MVENDNVVDIANGNDLGESNNGKTVWLAHSESEGFDAIQIESLVASQEAKTAALQIQATALSDGSQAQAFALDILDSASRRLLDALTDIAGQAVEAQEQADSTKAVAVRGQKSVTESLSAMDSLAQSSRQIEDLAVLINGVAKQTDLLALNAAIEAARVGEQGKGFAVIADEIRKLSTQVKGAVAEVALLVSNTGQWLDQGVKLSEMVHQDLGQIGQAAEQALDVVTEIVDAAHAQMQSANKSHQAVEEVRAISESNTVAADDLLEHSSSLGSLTGELIQLLQNSSES